MSLKDPDSFILGSAPKQRYPKQCTYFLPGYGGGEDNAAFSVPSSFLLAFVLHEEGVAAVAMASWQEIVAGLHPLRFRVTT